MTVRCPACKTTFRIEDGRVPERGAHTVCPRCSAPFDIGTAGPGAEAPDDLFELPPAELTAVGDDDLFEVHDEAAATSTATSRGAATQRRRGLWGWLGRLFGGR